MEHVKFQINAALETLNSRSPSAADIKSLQANAPKLWDSLFQVMTYKLVISAAKANLRLDMFQATVYRDTSLKGSRDELKNSLANDKPKQTFFLALR